MDLQVAHIRRKIRYGDFGQIRDLAINRGYTDLGNKDDRGNLLFSRLEKEVGFYIRPCGFLSNKRIGSEYIYIVGGEYRGYGRRFYSVVRGYEKDFRLLKADIINHPTAFTTINRTFDLYKKSIIIASGATAGALLGESFQGFFWGLLTSSSLLHMIGNIEEKRNTEKMRKRNVTYDEDAISNLLKEEYE